MILLQGCVEPAMAPSIREAAIRLVARAGYEVVLADGEGCCGALSEHLGRADEAAGFARTNVVAWTRSGPFDAVVSALAIHHLEHPDKRALMARVHAALAPGGVFVNAEQVDGPTPELTALYAQRWAGDCRTLGASEEEIDAARERMRHDRCADVETQLAWLRDAGFAAADCTYRSWRFAVLIARREGGER